MLDKLVVSVIPKVTVRLQNRPDIAFPGVKLAPELLCCQIFAQSDGVVDDRIDTREPVKG